MKDNIRTTVGGIFLVVWTMGSLLIVNDDKCKYRTYRINVNSDTTLTELTYYPKRHYYAQMNSILYFKWGISGESAENYTQSGII